MNRSKRFPTSPLFQRLAPQVAPLAPRERALLWLVAAFVLIACFGPAMPDPTAGAGSGFADARAWRDLPFAMDVLSNLPFAAFGIWGLMRLRRFDTLHERLRSAAALDCAWLFFAGLIFTAAGSVFYHLQPDALRLAADRAGMAIAFAGMLGLAVCERVSLRAGWPAACVAFVGGLAAVAVYHERGDVLPWAVVQFGGMALVLVLTLLRPVPGAMGLKLGAVILFYGVAKLFELGDQAVFEATGEVVSGHTFKHLVAACAAWPVLQAVDGLTCRALRHNPRATAMTVRGAPTGIFE
ncbi:hypothetical protein ACSFA0_21820 [Variovorax sp. LT1P1]|uniref:hypothetical protein n=1 Tax=Variovorax sp. LT1P1 TaxID=3443730 RepID=UPI003F449C6A